MMDHTNFDKLANLIERVFGVNNIGPDTEVNRPGTLSEDYDRFISLFRSTFQVDLDLLPYFDYFDKDQFIFLSLFKRFFRIKKDEKSLTVGHLLKVIENGKWVDP